MTKQTTSNISFEFFPPKTQKGRENLIITANKLNEFNAEFFSVTYGAGGSTKEGTLNAVLDLKQATGKEVAPHLSCIGDEKENLIELINLYKEKNIRKIVALRGDLPSGMGLLKSDLAYAKDLVALIRNETGDFFDIEVAAYPEMHPQAQNYHQDLQNFANKVKAGANSAITQYFFNIDSYFNFVDDVYKLGVEIPIIAGIMPIVDYEKLARFSAACGAEIPKFLHYKLSSYTNEKDRLKFSEEFMSSMCEKLLANKVPGLHFYTLNQADASLNIIKNLSLYSNNQ